MTLRQTIIAHAIDLIVPAAIAMRLPGFMREEGTLSARCEPMVSQPVALGVGKVPDEGVTTPRPRV
jgi:hypothetical protein